MAAAGRIPRHIAIVMDGNGRWATQRLRPRAFGHRAGVQAVRRVIEGCMRAGVEVLTLFAFSSENWSRPAGEVSHLMDLFLRSLRKQARELAGNGVCLRFIGDRARFSPELQQAMVDAESAVIATVRLTLNIAVNYGGRWDIVNAARALAREAQAGNIEPDAIDQQSFERHLSLAPLPEPDLFIRTGGDARISNFLLWHLAYTELYFTPVLWPDFDDQALNSALVEFAQRERRFGKTSAQVRAAGAVAHA
ncbi:MAG: di-trans,poly-cis-decaprenylcistransferase [Rhodanobacteraceae bacterium]|nr:di-trans,poly-cis-decaprenylcistransferase [Rhodanobacteraceae bacterium]